MGNYSSFEVCYTEIKNSDPRKYTLITFDDSFYCYELDESSMTVVKTLETAEMLSFEELRVRVFQELNKDLADTKMTEGFSEVLDFLVQNSILKIS
jgi:hypothetical protein